MPQAASIIKYEKFPEAFKIFIGKINFFDSFNPECYTMLNNTLWGYIIYTKTIDILGGIIR